MKHYAIWLALCLLLHQHVNAQDIEESLKKKVMLSGSIDARIIGYSVNGIAPRRTPWSYILSGSPTLNLYGLEIPFSFSLSEQDRSFSQPFNQFGLSPRYKWLTVHAGYRNLSFSPYTLDGHTMMGAGLELNPKKLHLAVMYGRLNRATTVDTTTGAIQPFSFSRKGWAAKLGLGNYDRSFFEVSALRAQDDSASISIDQNTKQQVLPSANAVASIRTRIQFFKKFFVEADGGASLWTNDIGSKIPVADSGGIIEKLNNIIPVNATSEFYAAYSTGVGYRSNHFSLKAEYRHVDPGFRSMGVYFFNNDIESYSLATSFDLLKSRLRFNGSFGWQSDNVKDQKEATSKRIIGTANVGWDINSRFGVDVNYGNFSTNSKPVVVQIQNKYLLTQSNYNFSVTPRFMVANATFSHVVIASYTKSALSDHNDITKTINNVNTDVFFLNYHVGLVKRFLNFSAGFNVANNSFSAGTFKNTGFNVGVNKSWLKGKLLVGVSDAYTISKGLQGKAAINSLNFNSSYMQGRHHRVSLRFNMLSNKPEVINTGNINFTESTGELGYTFSF